MSEAKHTPEPPEDGHTPEPWGFKSRNWRGEESEFKFYVIGDVHEDEETGRLKAVGVAVVEGNATSGGIPMANAKRIAACVNACKGIGTEALAAGAVADLLEACRIVLGATVNGRCHNNESGLEIVRAAVNRAAS
jgi:hypothetical protein